MNNRLQQFLELENITPARLADTLGVQRSGLSHILSGRNKPGFEFITKLLTKFPHINSEWLIMGKGKPYKEMNTRESASSPLPFSESKNFSNGQNQNSPTNINGSNQYDSILYDSIQNSNIPYDGIPNNIVQYGGLQSGEVSYSDIQSNDISSVNLAFPDNFLAVSPESNSGQTAEKTVQQSENLNITPKNASSQPSENRLNAAAKGIMGQKKRIKRVIVFYSDGSFEELFPHIR